MGKRCCSGTFDALSLADQVVQKNKNLTTSKKVTQPKGVRNKS